MIREAFVDAMSRAATGVNVVTTNGDAGQFGLTVSAMCSVSADPPTLLVCINRRNPIRDAILANGVFGVSVLRADQKRVAETFSGRPRLGAPYDFSTSTWDVASTGSPLLVGAVGRFDCQVADVFESGSHTIFTGKVIGADAHTGSPLAYYHRRFAEMNALPLPRGETWDEGMPVWDEPAPADEERTE